VYENVLDFEEMKKSTKFHLTKFNFIRLRITNFKNCIFPLRRQCEEACRALLRFCGCREIEFGCATKRMDQAELDDEIAAEKRYHDDKCFYFIYDPLVVEFSLLQKVREALIKWNSFSLWLPVSLELDIQLHALPCSQLESLPNVNYLESMEEETMLLIKPNGMDGFVLEKLIKLLYLKAVCVDIRHYKYLSVEQFKSLYPNCLNRVYGEEWYTYTTSGPVAALKLKCFNLNEIRQLCIQARQESGFIWTKNILHCSADSKEAKENLSVFFEQEE